MGSIRTAVTLALFLSVSVAHAADDFDRLVDPAHGRYRIDATGFVTDAGHPKHPGDFHRYDIVARFFFDPETGEAALEFDSGEGDEKSTDRYFVRRGRIFQVDEKGVEIDATPLGDLSPATVAALHPRLVAKAALARRENVAWEKGEFLFAWNDEMWHVRVDAPAHRIETLERRFWNDVVGNREESIRFEAWADRAPTRVVVVQDGREVAHLEFAPAVPDTTFDIPDGNRDRDRARVIAAGELRLNELAPHVFAIDVASMNTRVTVAEFSDHLFVFEGVYNSHNCDVVAEFLRKSFAKPVRYFAFSHLHGQYIGGTRSWIHEGATIVVPPSTAPLIEAIAAGKYSLRPDALSRDPKPLRVETVATERRFEDETNVLEIYNVASGHTDEYFIVYFPRPKILLTGDLLFYYPGKPLTGRSKQLCDTVAKLGLDVDRFVATWPLAGYGTENIVSREAMRSACTP